MPVKEYRRGSIEEAKRFDLANVQPKPIVKKCDCPRLRTASISDRAGPNQLTQYKRAFVLLGNNAPHDFFSNRGIFAIR
jgi:hypothetical protein